MSSSHSLEAHGYEILPDVVGESEAAEALERLKRAWESVEREVGADRLRAAGDLGTVRLLPARDPWFLRFLEIPALVERHEALLGPRCILRFQTGFLVEPGEADAAQYAPHVNNPRVLGMRRRGGLETALALTPLALRVVPGSHLVPGGDEIDLEVPARALLVMDSTLWHRDTPPSAPRASVNQQYTLAFMKPHFDFVRALGEERIRALPPRTRRLLGWESRVPTSLEEHYREERLYLGD